MFSTAIGTQKGRHARRFTRSATWRAVATLKAHRQEVVGHRPARRREAQVIRVPGRAHVAHEGAELLEVAGVQRIGSAERHREPVREHGEAPSEALERGGKVPTAPHVVLRGDLEEVDASCLRRRVAREELVEKLPPQAEAYAAHLTSSWDRTSRCLRRSSPGRSSRPCARRAWRRSWSPSCSWQGRARRRRGRRCCGRRCWSRRGRRRRLRTPGAVVAAAALSVGFAPHDAAAALALGGGRGASATTGRVRGLGVTTAAGDDDDGRTCRARRAWQRGSVAKDSDACDDTPWFGRSH